MRPPFEVTHDRLAVYLGPNTARNAVKMLPDKSEGVAPENMTPEQARLFLQALPPVMETLLGTPKREKLLAHTGIELDLRT
jgi:hypothetical protein